ncbi:hypothetical protein C8R45DRAFT_1024433, partial [Mycena sanguinolenta]
MLFVFVLLATAATTLAAVKGRAPLDLACSADGGVSTSALGPNDPEDINCCTETRGGQCQFTETCTESHYILTNLCPGPSNLKESNELDKRLPSCWT